MTTEALAASEALSARGATHPRVSVADIEASIAETYYVNAQNAVCGALGDPNHPIFHDDDHPLGLLTLCFVVCRNGFTVVGKSAPASPENFDAEKGRTFAYEDAIKQLWPLMGFALRERLAASD